MLANASVSDGMRDAITKGDIFSAGLYIIRTHANCKISLPQATAYLKKNKIEVSRIINRKIDLKFGSYFENIMEKYDSLNISLPNSLLKELNDDIEEDNIFSHVEKFGTAIVPF